MNNKNNNDRLDLIFQMQKKLDDKIQTERNIEFSSDEWIQKEILAIISELSEVLMETNFKWWKNDKIVDKNKLHEELIDVLHFYVSLCIRCGLDSDTLYDVYIKKNQENINRQDGKSDKYGYKPDSIQEQ